MSPSVDRDRTIFELLGLLQRVAPGQRALVAIDGFDGAGKTYLSRELHSAASSAHRPMVSVSIDDFHHSKAERVAAGTGPDGFYRGSYRYDEFRRCVVDPLRSGQPITPAVWDVERDAPVTAKPLALPADVIVVVDGIFLQRPELTAVWNATVWVDVPFAVSVPRGNARFADARDDDPEAGANHRYVGGQRLYLAEAEPRERSTWVLDNTDLDRPVLIRRQRDPC